jgi:hypothetical protein
MAKSNTSILDAARRWLDRGYFPIPAPLGTKHPVLDGWPELRLTVPDLPYFGEPSNIGVLQCVPYGATDIDLAIHMHTWRESGVEIGWHLGQQP